MFVTAGEGASNKTHMNEDTDNYIASYRHTSQHRSILSFSNKEVLFIFHIYANSHTCSIKFLT